LTMEAVVLRGARAGGEVESTTDRLECDLAGGKVTAVQGVSSSNPTTYVCDTFERDRQCDQTKLSPKDGKPTDWQYNYKTRECQPSDCFLTTACVERAGLPDDCFELSTLRRFRDEVLSHLPGGTDDIALYYRHAPAIVTSIVSTKDASRELARLYARYIVPSALATWLGCHGTARTIYTRMMTDLGMRHRVSLI
jgi:hypothetical protein